MALFSIRLIVLLSFAFIALLVTSIILPLAIVTVLITSTPLSPCTNRTPTSQQTLFALTRPDPVIYDFKNITPAILLTIPSGSLWRSEEAFSSKPEACATLLTLSGYWALSGHGAGSTTCGPGFMKPQIPLTYLSWFRMEPEAGGSASLRLEASVPFYRTVCSVVQDADNFFRFCTTPLWLRSMYHATYMLPFVGAKIRESMINTVLWYQLRVVYDANDFWTYEWEIPYLKWYGLTHPDRARKKQIESRYWITKKVVKGASWVGRRMMGMKESYVEYEADVGDDIPELEGIFKVQKD